jgi:hypothetical protein
MKISTPIDYWDSTGHVRSELIKEDNRLTMVLRGIVFVNENNDGWKPQIEIKSMKLSEFMIEDGYLCGFSMKILEKQTRVLWSNNDGLFKDLNILLDKLDTKVAVQDQLEYLLPFKSLSNAQIKTLATVIKDEAAGMALYYIGATRMGHILPTLLTNIQDRNWPAWRWTAMLLVDIGEKLIPEIKNAFETVPCDTIWHNNIIWVLNHWDRQLVNQLKTELIDTVLKADFDDASISALQLLHKKQLIEENESSKYYNFLEDKYANNVDMLEDLKELKAIINTDNSKP